MEGEPGTSVDREPPGGTAIFITAHHLKKKIQHTAGGTALRGGDVQEEFWTCGTVREVVGSLGGYG